VTATPTPTVNPTPTPNATPTATPTPNATPTPGARINVALTANGSIATGSTELSGANVAIDGIRTWATSGAWKDATPDNFPDWLQVDFNTTRTINEIDVYAVKNNFSDPADPTEFETLNYYGITNFEVQYWTGANWQTVPGGNVINTNRVITKVVFAPITTSRIRVFITGAQDSYSRIVELEAWGGSPVATTPTPTVNPTPTSTPVTTPTPTPSSTPTATPTPSVSPTSQLSKEYIYAGGRLLAVEEAGNSLNSSLNTIPAAGEVTRPAPDSFDTHSNDSIGLTSIITTNLHADNTTSESKFFRFDTTTRRKWLDGIGEPQAIADSKTILPAWLQISTGSE
jgi:hypothetical protein